MMPLRYLWVSPATLVGLPLAAIARLGGARARRVQGVFFEVEAFAEEARR